MGYLIQYVFPFQTRGVIERGRKNHLCLPIPGFPVVMMYCSLASGYESELSSKITEELESGEREKGDRKSW